MQPKLSVSIFGIGYVGAVSAGCLARDGHRVIAVDVSQSKIDILNAGKSPIVEPGLEALLGAAVGSGTLRATSDVGDALAGSDVSFICVGTPSAPNGSLDISYLEAVTRQVGEALAKKTQTHSVVYRSTMLPGTMMGKIVPLLEKVSGKRAGKEFGVGYYPEFLRESTAIADYDSPGVIVFGARDATTAQRLQDMHAEFPVKPMMVDIPTAEAIKYANNCWHALKISFANEIGNICQASGVDGHAVMATLCTDTRLNISPAYLKPGFAFGGSCLPKDLRALRYHARQKEVPSPVLEAALLANENQLDRAYRLVAACGARRVGLLGLSFKSGTDDLRESPLVELVERLHGRGYEIQIYDPNIQMTKLVGANLSYVRERLPHLAKLLCDKPQDVLAFADVLVIGDASLGRQAWPQIRAETEIVDLVRVEETRRSEGRYKGLCW